VASGIELWGGIECTVNRVKDRWFDQIAWSGHAARPDDLDRLAALGVRALRIPVLWEHVAPASLDHPDWRASDERLERLSRLGIRPIVGLLHHGSGPAYTSLLDDQFPALLARFARMVAERYPWVADYTPVNEPLTTARFSALYGHWYPHKQDARAFVRALLNELRATRAAMEAIRRVNANARLIATEDCGDIFGTPETAAQVEHERRRRWLTWDVLTGAVGAQHPLRRYLIAHGASSTELDGWIDRPCSPAVLGLNYYVTSDRFLDHRLDRYPPEWQGGSDVMRYVDVEAVRARPEGIAGHETHLMETWERYRLPVALTEVHLGCSREEQVRWLVEAWSGALAAERRGANVVAVTPWALLGSYDWDSLVTRPAGHYEPGALDVRSPSPRWTKLARVMIALGRGRVPSCPVLDTPGWWRRSERLLFSAEVTHTADSRTAMPSGRPIVIIGATGTLGRAFDRLCRLRGLPSRLVGRAQVDIACPADVDAMLRSTAPWAVVNAAGYVRVDDAEADANRCDRENVTGAAHLAAACRRHGVRLVTFSSDLVFDGQRDHPYTEDDVPRPLNVYGRSKAEAERLVLQMHPSALVVRTSAFFGPWDSFNFVSQTLRALATGRQVRAPIDAIVSPTYVPDLVHAVLDLMIDGERGLWHLANSDAVTWHDLACRVAELQGLDRSLIEPVPAADIWRPAIRPRYSALASNRGQLLRPLDDALRACLREMAEQDVLATGVDKCA